MQDHAAPGATAESVPPSASERVHTAVLIGRFQPLHNGHMALLQAALARSDQVVVVLGSAWQAPNPKNPFSWQERAQMLREALPPADAARLRCVPVRDYYFGEAGVDFEALAAQVPPATLQFLRQWATTPVHAQMCKEWHMLARYRQAWAAAPYPPVFVTVDALLRCRVPHEDQQRDHILLIRRGHAPGQGLWALPGGFLEPRDTLWQSCLRELREETCSTLTIPTAACAGAPSPMCTIWTWACCPPCRPCRAATTRHWHAGWPWATCPAWRARSSRTTSRSCASSCPWRSNSPSRTRTRKSAKTGDCGAILRRNTVFPVFPCV
jgi:cytidyltransferase-like protein